MKNIVLKGTKRAAMGRKADVKELRRSDLIPCVLYGQGVENVHFAVGVKEMKQITHTPNSYIINVDLYCTGLEYM